MKPRNSPKRLTPRGMGKAWLDEHVNYAGDDCLIWPFCKTKVTFIRVDGFGVKTYVYMCEQANGPKPTPIHQAAHSCGKGHLGCVHPKHLRWATPKENIADKKIHGTQPLGEAVHCSKLTKEQVSFIRKNPSRIKGVELAKMFGVTNIQISRIRTGRAWAWM